MTVDAWDNLARSIKQRRPGERVPLLKRLEDRTRELKVTVEAAQRTRHLIQEQITFLRMGGTEAEALAVLRRQGISL